MLSSHWSRQDVAEDEVRSRISSGMQGSGPQQELGLPLWRIRSDEAETVQGPTVTEGVSHNKCSETYCGPEAFSEPETQNIRDFVMTLEPVMMMMIMIMIIMMMMMQVPVLGHCFHSYSQLWLWPYGYDYNVYPENR